jgi:hypothetical protein
MSLIELLRWALCLVLWLTLLHVVLSWVNPHAPIAPAVSILVRPFLAPFQRELAAALPVPVAVSSLLQVPWVERLLAPGRRCGVITIDATALGPAHLLAAGALADTPVAGMPADGELARTIFDDRADLDWCAAGDELVRTGRSLVRRHPEVGAIVLECTNLPPYRRRLARALGLPVYDVGTLLDWFWSGLAAALPGSGAVDGSADDRTAP